MAAEVRGAMMLWWAAALMVVLGVVSSQAKIARCTISANVDRAGKVERVLVAGRGMNEAIDKFRARVGGPIVNPAAPDNWRLPTIHDISVKCR